MEKVVSNRNLEPDFFSNLLLLPTSLKLFIALNAIWSYSSLNSLLRHIGLRDIFYSSQLLIQIGLITVLIWAAGKRFKWTWKVGVLIVFAYWISSLDGMLSLDGNLNKAIELGDLKSHRPESVGSAKTSYIYLSYAFGIVEVIFGTLQIYFFRKHRIFFERET